MEMTKKPPKSTTEQQADIPPPSPFVSASAEREELERLVSSTSSATITRSSTSSSQQNYIPTAVAITSEDRFDDNAPVAVATSVASLPSAASTSAVSTINNATSTTKKESSKSNEKSFNDDDIKVEAVTNNNNDFKSSPLPIAELIHGAGSISTRISLRALVMKKWHPSYWMHYGPHTLLIFRSKEHMDDWATNPYHSSKQREFLVKLEINFMVDMESNDGKDAGILGHRLLPMKQKSYGKKDEDEMYQFKLERWTNLGCSYLAAFASHDEKEVQVVYDTICDILKTCPNNGLKDMPSLTQTSSNDLTFFTSG